MTITLTEDEAQTLVNLLDSAVKAIGLSAAPAALGIFQKLKDAAETPAQEPEE
jgi:hypothetical protein